MQIQIMMVFVFDDGDSYATVQIDEQLWMVENLKVTHYRNGDEIPTLDNATWSSTEEGAYGIYDNVSSNAEIYGNLYNGYVVTDERGICPEDWHVATDDEFKDLELFLGMNLEEVDTIGYRGEDEGGKMKQIGLEHWNSPNTGATNESGFTALPGGMRHMNGGYFYIENFSFFWSSSEIDSSSNAWGRWLAYNRQDIYRDGMSNRDLNKNNGYSIRCLED